MQRVCVFLAVIAVSHGWWLQQQTNAWKHRANQLRDDVNRLRSTTSADQSSITQLMNDAANFKRQAAEERARAEKAENAPKPVSSSAETQKLEEQLLEIRRTKSRVGAERTQALLNAKAATSRLAAEEKRRAEVDRLVSNVASALRMLKQDAISKKVCDLKKCSKMSAACMDYTSSPPPLVSFPSQRSVAIRMSSLRSQLSAVRARVAAAKSEAAKAATLSATEIDQARQASDAAANSRLSAEGEVSAAEASVTAAASRLTAERESAKRERGEITSKVLATVNKAKAALALAKQRRDSSKLAAETALRAANAAKVTTERTAAQLHASMIEHAATLATLKKTLNELQAQHTQAAGKVVALQAGRSSQIALERKRVLSGALQRMTDLQSRLQLSGDQRFVFSGCKGSVVD